MTAIDATNAANGGQTVTGTSSPITVTGLTNGDSYTFTVTATNAVGTGLVSGASNPVTPAATAPSAPTDVSATAGDGQATVTFTPPTDDGGSPITGYEVTATDTTNPAASFTSVHSGSPALVTGLTNGDTYTFTVNALNAVGAGLESDPSNAVVPVGDPGAPTGVSASAGNASATVVFTAPTDDGGSTITSYTVTATDTTHPANGGQTAKGPGSPITVSGLTNGDTYTFTVTATNTVGAGPTSSASSPVVPTAPIPVVSVVATGALSYADSGAITSGQLKINPATGTVSSATGTITIPGAKGGTTTITIQVARLFGVYVGDIRVTDSGERLSTTAVILTTTLTRTATGQLTGTATGLVGFRAYTLKFTI